ncbi:prepilin-type N-terminal cleavage/methylation domain-containing protein, partial [Alteromonas sp. BZK5]
MKKTGFTLVELIITILVIGVLAVTAAPRFLGNDTEEAIALRDRTLQVVRNMQFRAMQNVQNTS